MRSGSNTWFMQGLGHMEHQNKRRICCFCETWESGGIESFLYNVLTRIDLTHLEIDLVAAEIRKSIFTAELQKKGVQFYELSGSPRRLFQNWITFQKLLRQRKYDVVHFNVFHGLSLVYVQLAKQADVPIRIVHGHGSGLRHSRTQWVKLRVHQLGKMLFSNAATDRWACSSVAAAFIFPQCIIKQGRYQWIPNGIEISRFCFQPQERKRLREKMGLLHKFVIGHVGRLSEEKNQMFLLDVFSELHKCCPESRLLLIGDGPMKFSLQQRADELGIAKYVNFFGATTQIPQLLWAMDAFVFPSLFEGLGIAGIEAQAAGLPVFCSDHIPAEARVSSQFYRLSLRDAPSKWAEAIQAVARHKGDRCRGAEQVRAAGFEITEVARKIEIAYGGHVQ